MAIWALENNAVNMYIPWAWININERDVHT